MAKRQLKLYSTQTAGGTKNLTTTISDINTEATSTVMTNFAKKLNSLTTNTYGQTDLVETVNVDTEDIKIKMYLEPDLSSGKTGATNTTFHCNSNYKAGDATVFTGFAIKDETIYTITQTAGVVYRINGANTVGEYTVYLGKVENENYTSCFIKFNITTTAS